MVKNEKVQNVRQLSVPPIATKGKTLVISEFSINLGNFGGRLLHSRKNYRRRRLDIPPRGSTTPILRKFIDQVVECLGGTSGHR